MYTLQMNSVYSFKFTDPFNQLDGIYKAIERISFPGIIAKEVDLYPVFYGVAGLSADKYEAEIHKYKDADFFVLQDMANPIITIFIPEVLLAEYPDFNIWKYGQVSIVSKLGFFDNPQLLASLRSKINDIVACDIGSTVYTTDGNGDIEVDNTAVVCTSTKWMSIADYEAITQARTLVKDQLTANRSNYFLKNRDLEEENLNLKAKITALEEIIVTNSL